jgi:hypothetical protein
MGVGADMGFVLKGRQLPHHALLPGYLLCFRARLGHLRAICLILYLG